ncbi:MAG: hypothetical protein FJZ67_01735 [Bacteroidetes bacterium]|nr:hypothetical protein [Bacteroidota bacterium]
MAGGKETPRQKMIGMMYLVLMAMLALNVSKSIIDAFVAIEENIQIANQNENGRGSQIRKDVVAKVETGDTPAIREKAKRLLAEIDKIDKLTAEQIQYIDAIKMEILSEIKESEELLKEGPEDKGFIIEKAFNASEPTKPIRFRLANVQNKDKYDEVMRIMGIANTTEKPESYSCVSKFAKGKKSGIDLWNSLTNYRATICKILVESSSNDSVKYKFKDPEIKQFETQESLKAEILKQFSSKNWIVHKSDSSVVSDIYIALTKREMVKNEHEKGKMEHWIGKTFNHAPAVGALASLSGLQKEILTARADAITIIKGRIGGGDFSFNSIVALATPKFAVVQPQSEIELEVRMAAYDSDRQPIIKPDQGTLKGDPANGVGIVTARATNGKMEFSGTVSITDKYGAQKTEKYTAVVQVAAGGGALEMPEYLVLYQGYDNFVVPSLSGALDPALSAPGCSVTKTTRDGKKGYIVRPGAGAKSVTMSVSGKGGDGKPIKGISNTYKVKRFPAPVVKVSTISKSMGQTITAGLPGDSPLRAPNFTVKSVELLLGDNNPTFSANIPGSAVQKLKVNKKIGISVVVYNPITKTTDVVSGELKITN